MLADRHLQNLTTESCRQPHLTLNLTLLWAGGGTRDLPRRLPIGFCLLQLPSV